MRLNTHRKYAGMTSSILQNRRTEMHPGYPEDVRVHDVVELRHNIIVERRFVAEK